MIRVNLAKPWKSGRITWVDCWKIITEAWYFRHVSRRLAEWLSDMFEKEELGVDGKPLRAIGEVGCNVWEEELGDE